MKTLLLIRHAKSSWDKASVTDFERKLNERGKHDAPLMAKRLFDREIKIDAFVSSPAKRAKKTAEIFMHEFNEKEKHLILVPQLYEASVNTFYGVIENLKDQYGSVALFAHNPAITDVVNSFGTSPVNNMPTCAVYAIKIDTDKWAEIQNAEKEWLFFDFPKDAEE